MSGAIVITGASTGIGQACALYLDKLGFQVFAGVRKDTDAQALRQKASERLTPIFLDVTNSEMIVAAVKLVADSVGNTDLLGLVNNAGIVVGGPLEFLPIAEFAKQLEVNVTAQLAVTQAFLPLLRKSQGRIVNMGSISGLGVSPFTGAYAASKFALEAVTDALRMELLPWGISVSIIEPGAIATPIWEKSLAEGQKIYESLPQIAHDLYEQTLTSVAKTGIDIGNKGISAVIVAKAVAHALTAKTPKTRYLIGLDAKIGAMLTLLPDKVRDRIILKFVGCPLPSN